MSALCVHPDTLQESRDLTDTARVTWTFDDTHGSAGIAQRILRFGRGLSAPRGETQHELLFVVDGRLTFVVDSARHEVVSETGIHVPPGTNWRIRNDHQEEVVIVSWLAPDDELGDSEAAPFHMTRPAERDEAEALSGRQSRIIIDASIAGRTSVTQFVGYIPPGRAPEHYHHHDEVLYVLEGNGVLHTEGSSTSISTGTCIHFPARVLHSVENLDGKDMRVIGVIRPAGSPEEAYYADGTQAVLGIENHDESDNDGARSPTQSTSPIRRSGIREIMDLAESDDVLALHIGEPDSPTPPHILEAALKWAAGGNVKYTVPRGLRSLRDLLSEKVRERNQLAATADEVVITGGGTPALSATLGALLDPGDQVLVSDPGWPGVELMIELFHGRVLRYRLVPETGYQPDLDHLRALAPYARVLIINSPNNPTGAVYSRETLEGMMEIARRFDLLVLSDEVYEEIVFDGEHVSPGSMDEDGRVISIFSFSKTYAMTGWRVGYAVATRRMAERIVGAQEAMLACPSSISQVAAIAAITGPQTCVADMRETYRRRRDIAVAALGAAGMLVSVPRGTFYVVANARALGRDTYVIARRLALERKVAVAPGATFGPRGSDILRLSLASTEAVITEGIARITGAADDWPGLESTDTRRA